MGDKRLTPVMRRFCRAVASGTHKSYSDAYAATYAVSGCSRRTVRNEASRLVRHPLVTAELARLERLADLEASRSRVSTKRYVTQALRVEAEGVADSTAASRVRSLELLGRSAGLFPSQVEVGLHPGGVPVSEAETLAEIEALLARIQAPGGAGET